jgi:hypothetical protein
MDDPLQIGEIKVLSLEDAKAILYPETEGLGLMVLGTGLFFIVLGAFMLVHESKGD